MKVLFIAPVDKYDAVNAGYGNASASLLYILKTLAKDKQIDYLEVVNINAINRDTIEKCLKTQFDISFTICHPSSFINPNVLNIFNSILSTSKQRYLNILWETNKLPTSWNFLWETQLFTGFTAPSTFLKDLIEKCTDKPVYYLPYYIDVNKYSKIDIEEKKKEDIFSVLMIGQSTQRKGLKDGTIAFVRSLGINSDCRLNIKYHQLSPHDLNIEQIIPNIVKTNCLQFKAQIHASKDTIKTESIINLYKNSSLLLFCSRGEGFGLPSVEASSIGIPVLYTSWSSLPEVSEMPGNEPIDYFLESTIGMAHHGYEMGSYYSMPVVAHMEQLLLKKYAMWKEDKEAYYNLSKDNHVLVNKKFGRESIRNYFKIIFKELS